MLCITLSLSVALATPRAEPISWANGGTSFAGYLVYDDATTARRPGLLMVPNWMGVTPAAVEKAQKIAGTRYVVLVADVYGKDLRPANDDEASKAAGALYEDRPLLRARVNAALRTLQAQSGTAPLDATHIGAIGFCFGGSTVLELARSGTPLDGVVSFHGGLATPSPAGKGALHTPVLVLNGAADSYVPPKDIGAFQTEMDTSGADWQFVQFSGAVHCFTEPAAASPGCRYDARTAARAYGMMNDFFTETFAVP